MERPASNSSNDSEEQQRENMKLIRSKHPFSSAMPPPVSLYKSYFPFIIIVML